MSFGLTQLGLVLHAILLTQLSKWACPPLAFSHMLLWTRASIPVLQFTLQLQVQLKLRARLIVASSMLLALAVKLICLQDLSWCLFTESCGYSFISFQSDTLS